MKEPIGGDAEIQEKINLLTNCFQFINVLYAISQVLFVIKRLCELLRIKEVICKKREKLFNRPSVGSLK